jgi:hypothetical protein
VVKPLFSGVSASLNEEEHMLYLGTVRVWFPSQ